MAREIAILLTAAGRALTLSFKQTADANLIGILQSGARFIATDSMGGRGSKVSNAAALPSNRVDPFSSSFTRRRARLKKSQTATRLMVSAAKAKGMAHVHGPANTEFTFKDDWLVKGNVIQLSRTVHVSGACASGFLSAIMLSHPESHPRSEVDYLAPGMIYGSSAHLSACVGRTWKYDRQGMLVTC